MSNSIDFCGDTRLIWSSAPGWRGGMSWARISSLSDKAMSLLYPVDNNFLQVWSFSSHLTRDAHNTVTWHLISLHFNLFLFTNFTDIHRLEVNACILSWTTPGLTLWRNYHMIERVRRERGRGKYGWLTAWCGMCLQVTGRHGGGVYASFTYWLYLYFPSRNSLSKAYFESKIPLITRILLR